MKHPAKCDWCKKNKATYTATRDIDFGHEVIVAHVCRTCAGKGRG